MTTSPEALIEAVARLTARADAWSLNGDGARLSVRLGDLRTLLSALQEARADAVASSAYVEAAEPFFRLAREVINPADYERPWHADSADGMVVFSFAGQSVTLGDLRRAAALAAPRPMPGREEVEAALRQATIDYNNGASAQDDKIHSFTAKRILSLFSASALPTPPEGADRPISPLRVLADDGPEWQAINALFVRHGLEPPPVRLRDELVNHLAWAKFGAAEAAHAAQVHQPFREAPSSPPPHPAKEGK